MSLRFLTAGESHGPRLTAILEGLPAGVKIDIHSVNRDLARRQQGYGRGGRMKIETDKAEILSGVRFGETLGGPITLSVENRDFANWREKMAAFGPETGPKVTAARPGHADLTGVLKYDRKDVRDILERSSARETAMRVAVGGICKEFLKNFGMEVVSHVTNIGGAKINEENIDRSVIGKEQPELNCYDSAIVKEMMSRIDAAKERGDTLGGVFEIIVRGAVPGLGSFIQWDKRLDARLAAALMSIQAIKGVEIGAGFGVADLPGSKVHDEIFADSEKNIFRKTNRAGGIEGGMSNGEEILLRAAMKPIPTLMQPLHSIDIQSREGVLASKERSDTCAVSAASVVGEAMVAFVMADAVCEKFGHDALSDMLASARRWTRLVSPCDQGLCRLRDGDAPHIGFWRFLRL